MSVKSIDFDIIEKDEFIIVNGNDHHIDSADGAQIETRIIGAVEQEKNEIKPTKWAQDITKDYDLMSNESGTKRSPESFLQRGRGVVEIPLLGLAALAKIDPEDWAFGMDDIKRLLDRIRPLKYWNVANGRQIYGTPEIESWRNSKTWRFTFEGDKISIEDYYFTRYGIRLQYPELHLLKVSEYEAFPLEIINVTLSMFRLNMVTEKPEPFDLSGMKFYSGFNR